MKSKTKPLSRRHPELHVSNQELGHGLGALRQLADIEQERAQGEPAPEPIEPSRDDESTAEDIVDRYLKSCGGERMGFVVGASERELITDIAIALLHARGRTEP